MPQDEKKQKETKQTKKKEQQRYKVIDLKSTDWWKEPTQKELDRLKDDSGFSLWDWWMN